MPPSNDVTEIEDYSASSGLVVRQDPVFYNYILRFVATVKKFFLNVHVLKSYTVAQALAIAATSSEGLMIYVSNESGGKVMAFHDGTTFRRVTDRAVIT